MRKVLFNLLLIALPSMAAAQDSASFSEYMFQAEAGKLFLTPSVNYSMTQRELSTGSAVTETDTNLWLGKVEAEYGLSPMFSAGLSLTYTQGTAETTSSGTTLDSDISGLNDIQLFAKGLYGLSNTINLKYGLTGTVSIEDREIKSNGDMNAASGGYSVIPFVGIEAQSEKCIFGGKIDTQYWIGERNVTDNGTDTKEKDGGITNISAFYEHLLSDTMRVGASLNHAIALDKKVDGQREGQLSYFWDLNVYVPMELGRGTLLPSIGVGTSSDEAVEAQTVDKYQTYSAEVGYRISF